MTHVSYSELRNNLAKYMDQVVEDRVELHVTRQDHPGVVLMSEEEFAGWKETVHLLSSPANAPAADLRGPGRDRGGHPADPLRARP